MISHNFHKYVEDSRVPLLVLLIIVVCFLVSSLSVVGYFRVNVGTPITLPTIKAAVPTPIAGMHLFGIYASDYNDLPETQLQLVLQGTEISKAESGLSLALIQSSSKTKVYHVGDSVPGGATIHAIQEDRVIINDNGELERLSMPIPKLSIIPATAGLPANSGLSSS
jgi:general secretion pathway protein C